MASSGLSTNDEIKHRIQKVYAKFVSDVEPDRLSDWLVQENIITIDEKQRIRNANHTTTGRCRALLDHLFFVQHPRAFIVVQEALSDQNHYLLEYIDNHPLYHFSGLMTNDEIKHRIQKVYAKFVSDVEPDRLSDWLVQENVITIDEKQRIRNTNHTTTDRCRALLDHLLCTQHPRAFIVVRKALSEQNHYLLEYIDYQTPCAQPQTETVQHDKTKLQQQLVTEQEAHERTLEAGNDRLLKMQNDLDEKLHLGPKMTDVLNPSSSSIDCFTRLARMKKLLCTELTDLFKEENYLKIRRLVERPTVKETDLENFWSLAFPYIIQSIKTWNGNVLTAQNIAAMVERTPKHKRGGTPRGNAIQGSTIYPVSRLDCIAYIINVADYFVVQDILCIMSKFPMAIPLVIPDTGENGKYIVVAPALQNITVKWESITGHIAENHLLSGSFRMICAVRLGANKIGKSTILNQLTRKQFVFSSRGEPGSRYGRPWTLDGTVEIVWLTQQTCSDITWETTMRDHYKRNTEEIAILANLHGDALQYPDTLKYLEHLSCSFIVFRMPNSTDDEFNQLRNSIAGQNIASVLVDPKENLEDPKEHLDETSDIETIYTDSLTSADTQDTVRSLLRFSLNTHFRTESPHPSPLYDLDKFKSLRYTESLQCKQSEDILYIVKIQGCFSVKQLLMNIDVQQYTKWNESLKRLLRSLLDIFNQLPSDSKKSLIYLENQLSKLSTNESAVSRAQVRAANEKLQQMIVKAQKKRKTEDNFEESRYHAKFEKAQAELQSAMEKADNINLGKEHFCRALSQIYEKSFGSGATDLGDFHSIRDLPSRFADLLISGYAIELLDGDYSRMQLVWIKAVCEKVTKKLPNLRVFVISIVGLQSSGKSALLNALFSCRFAASVGRCSRGLLMRMILIDEEIRQRYKCDAIILIETESLCSSEKTNDLKASQKDQIMATFAMGISNLTIVNVFGEGMTKNTEVLRIAIVAMSRLRRGGIKPDILVVQHLQDRNLSKITQAKGQICEAINKAYELVIENDVEIDSASEECLTELTAGIQSGDIFVHFGTYMDVNSPPSETHHEDVVRLQEALLKRTHAFANIHIFERWSCDLESFQRCARKGEFGFYFQFARQKTENEYFEKQIDKVVKLYAGSAWHHIAFFGNKIREQINLVIENKQKIHSNAMRKDLLDEMEHKLQAIPYDCSDTCEMCREFNSHYIFLLQENKNRELGEKIKHTLGEYNDMYHNISMNVLRQIFDRSVVKQRFLHESSAVITRDLKRVLESRPTGEFSTEEQREMVDSIWQFLQCIAISKESPPDLQTRMTETLFQEYVNSGVWTNIFQDLERKISVVDLLNAKATKCEWSKLRFKNENLTEDQMTSLISDLGQLVEAVLKCRLDEYCIVIGVDFEEQMVSKIKTKFPRVIKTYEEQLNITLNDGFKMLLQIYTLQQFINLMTHLQNLWNYQNKLSGILLQKKDDYITEIETRFKHRFSSAGEGKIVAKTLCKSIKRKALQDASIQDFKYISSTTHSEEERLHYFDQLDKEVAAAERVLQYFANPMQSIKSLYANEVDSLESFLASYRSTVKHELIRVKQQILNSDNKAELDKIVKEQIKNTDDQYYSHIDPSDDDFDAFRSSIVRVLDSFIESEDG